MTVNHGITGYCATCRHAPCRCKEASRTQVATKDNVTHRYVDKDTADPDKTYDTPEEHLTPWQKEWREIGMRMEADLTRVDMWTINAVIHAQILKRP